ncbi:hypothetical protein ACHOLT_13915 [Desulfitobacterium sp. Sab5]|uniref:hypothetical protein n=1 Tax=Desulfitobacterium nosdiversum TaxID=3375356 RepID=UPI003CF57D3E
MEEPIKYRVLVTLALFTGLRRGELLGLEWNAIDLNFRTTCCHKTEPIHIRSETVIVDKDPKIENSKRLVALSSSIVTLDKEYKVEQNRE